MSKEESFFNSDQDYNFGVRPEGHQAASITEPSSHPRFAGTKRDMNAKTVSLGSIVAKEQVRKHFDEGELAELAHSLRTVGQKTPILVYWCDQSLKYVIIAGERRFRAAQAAGLSELSCQVHPVRPDEAELVELQYVENAIRSDLNPIEEAQSYRKLQELKGYSTSQLAERIGKNQSTISRSLSLLKLPEEIQTQITTGKVPVTVAREVAKLDEPQEQQAMIARYLSGELNRDQVQAATSKTSRGTASRASTKQTKKWTQGGVTIALSYGKNVTLADIADVLETRAAMLRSDGRTKKAA